MLLSYLALFLKSTFPKFYPVVIKGNILLHLQTQDHVLAEMARFHSRKVEEHDFGNPTKKILALVPLQLQVPQCTGEVREYGSGRRYDCTNSPSHSPP